jgi:uncharacterized protein YaeQ
MIRHDDEEERRIMLDVLAYTHKERIGYRLPV